MIKQVELIIVDGSSEKIALEGLLKVLLTTSDEIIELISYDTDVLTDNNVLYKIFEKCLIEASKYGISPDEIKKITLISDLDGCYLNDDDIFECTSINKIQYHDDRIDCLDKSNIVRRNKTKRDNIELLLKTTNINQDGVNAKLTLHVNGCNLDHLLHGERNLIKKQKIKKAKQFALQYHENELEFVNFIQPFTHNMTYEELFDWIKNEKNSLKQVSTIYHLLKRE